MSLLKDVWADSAPDPAQQPCCGQLHPHSPPSTPSIPSNFVSAMASSSSSTPLALSASSFSAPTASSTPSSTINSPTQFFLPPLSAPPTSPPPAPSFGPPPTAEQFAAYRARAERREMVAVVGALVFAAAVLNYVARIHHRLHSLERLYQISKECY